jgi:hypothetical protein
VIIIFLIISLVLNITLILFLIMSYILGSLFFKKIEKILNSNLKGLNNLNKKFIQYKFNTNKAVNKIRKRNYRNLK